METLPCKLALWGFLWLAWGRSAGLADQKANRLPPNMRLNPERNLEIGHFFSNFRISFPLTLQPSLPSHPFRSVFSLSFLTSNCVKIRLVHTGSRNLSHCVLPRKTFPANTVSHVYSIPFSSNPFCYYKALDNL